MNDWASRRKSIILVALVLILSVSAFYIFWKFWYRTPTCFDRLQNGDETGVDCGGSCSLVCSDAAIRPVVRWDPRLFEVSPGVWSALVYVENSNANIDAVHVPYRLIVYGDKNEIIGERSSATILPKNKTVGVFESNIQTKGGIRAKRATFEIGDNIVWEKNEEKSPDINITHSPLLRLDSAPRVEANIKNNEIRDIRNIELVVAIFDGSDNAIAASRTFLDSLKKNEDTNVFFTWPKPFLLGEKVCENPSNVMLLLDRSGSMSSIQKEPPQPLGDAKKAAIEFVKGLGTNDKIGLASFATEVKNPIDLVLTNNLDSANQAINSVSIEKSGTQYTNIYAALRSAWQELVTARATEESSKIIILLTDGVATNPRNPGGGTEKEDIQYAEDLAWKESLAIKKDGVVIYTIGLGKDINESFLKQIASGDNNYFFAPSADNLTTIYNNISSHICKEVPTRIEITYKIFGNLID